MSTGKYLLAASSSLCLLAAPLEAQLLSAGAEFQVNTHTTGNQKGPFVAAVGPTTHVVVWRSDGQDGDSMGIFARRFDDQGNPISGEFQVNTHTTGDQEYPAIAGAGDAFIIAWTSVGQDGSDEGVFAQRFNSNGGVEGTEFQVATDTIGEQSTPGVTMQPGGSFVIAWQAPDGYYNGIFARRFDSGGSAIGSEFQVSQSTVSDQTRPVLAPLPGGDFVIAWHGTSDAYVSFGIYARRFDSSGAAQGSEFLVNVQTTTSQAQPKIAADTDGNFIVAWHGETTVLDVNARRYDSAGTALTPVFQVNTFTTSVQFSPAVATDASGAFAIAWSSLFEDGDLRGVFVRPYRSDGGDDGPPVQVNEYTTADQNEVDLSYAGDSFLAVWQGADSQDGDGDGIFARRFVRAGTPLSAKKLLLRTPPSGADKNKLVLLSKDPAFATPQSVEQDPRCAPLGSGSPTAGAALRIIGSGGETTIDLPCTNWSGNSDRTNFKYTDASGATCKTVIMKSGKILKMNCQGPQVAYALGGPGDVNVVLSTGDPTTNQKYCTRFGPGNATVVHDGSDGKLYKALGATAEPCL